MDVAHSIYELPHMLKKEGLDRLVTRFLGLDAPAPKLDEWEEVVHRLLNPKHKVRIGMVGKYMDLQDSYLSVNESLVHGGIRNDCEVEVIHIDAEDIEKDGPEKHLGNLNGILVPGGFGDRGTEGKVLASKYARENNLPYFGLCLGMQIAVIDFARNVLGLEKANSEEFDPDTLILLSILWMIKSQLRTRVRLCGLGHVHVHLKKELWPSMLTRRKKFLKDIDIDSNLIMHTDRKWRQRAWSSLVQTQSEILVEIVEVQNHPWYVGVQFHPEFQSKPNKAHPLFASFIEASLTHRLAIVNPGKDTSKSTAGQFSKFYHLV